MTGHRQQGFASSLTDDEMARITDLAEPGPGRKRLSAYRIGQVIGRPQAQVAWFMYRSGLHRRSTLPVRAPYMHRGILVRPYGLEEDAFIEAMRADGATLSAIARAVELRFGWSRRDHSIHVRLVMLAGFAEAETMGVAAE